MYRHRVIADSPSFPTGKCQPRVEPQEGCMVIFPEILRASDEVSLPIFCKLVHIYIYIYKLLPGVYMSQMVNVFYMSFMCL